MNKKPNVLLIMTDQHRADWLGCAGHPVVKTPNIDALAARGTRFTNFHVTSPVCMPNRGAIFTGRYPSVNGLRHNGLPLPADANTFVDVLRAEGYHTASIGKSHLQPFTSRPLVRVDEAYVANPQVPEARKSDGVAYENEQPDTYAAGGEYEVKTPYYGFEQVRMVTDHGDACGGHYLQWLKRQTNAWACLRDRRSQLPHDYANPQAFRTRIPEELYPTTYIRDEAEAYLKSRAGQEEPFFAFVSFPDPHHPFTPPGKYWDMYDPKDFAIDLPYEAHKNPPPQLKAWKELMDRGVVPQNPQQAFMASDQQLKEAMALTAGMITLIDDAVGHILGALKDAGLEDDTLLIFNSDHGDYMGAFSLLLKGPLPHGSVNRVPFIWVDPKARGEATVDGLATSLDIGPSILARCGVLPYYGMHGRSFLPQIEGSETTRDKILIEHEENKVYSGFDQRPILRNLVTDTHRLTVYKGLEFGELYDLRNDPNETHNLWDEPAAAQDKADLMIALNQAMLDAIEQGPWPKRFA